MILDFIPENSLASHGNRSLKKRSIFWETYSFIIICFHYNSGKWLGQMHSLSRQSNDNEKFFTELVLIDKVNNYTGLNISNMFKSMGS